jgi:hypothetical protein
MNPGGTLAGYVVEERIAVGGMAEIYRASRPGPAGFAKQVAIKVVLPELARDPEFVRMFLDEARLAARLSSPHLVQVFDAGQEGETYFLVMEYVDGMDLASLLAQQGPLPLALGAHLGRQLCAALADLHEATDADGKQLQVVHRDVSPGNVLLSLQGDVKLGDYGIAKALAGGLRTERGTLKGKLAYLSPEQARGEPVDVRTDIYGLGLVLFEGLTGQRYLEARGEPELLRAAAQPVLRAPSMVDAGLAPIDAVLGRALAPEPSRRYPSARLLDRELSGLLRERSPAELREQLSARVRRARDAVPSARPSAPPRPAVAPETPGAGRPATEVWDVAAAERRGPWRWLGLGVLAAALVGLVAFAALRQRAAPGPAGPPDAGQTARLVPATNADLRAPAARTSSVDAAAVRPDAALAVVPRRVVPRPRVRVRSAPDARPTIAADQGSTPRDATSTTRAAARAQLARVERLLRDKGLLPADAPALFARHRALAADPARASRAELERLEAEARAFVVDRAFVDAKLRRLNARIRALETELAEALKRRLQQHTQQALSYAVTGRYREANRELNAIARLIQR